MNNKLFIFVTLCLVLSSSPFVLGANNDSNSGGSSDDSSGGIPNRIALVEKVLEVERLTKQPTLDLKGTDYQPYDEGTLLAYVLEGNIPVADAMCLINVVYPNKTSFINQQLMLPIDVVGFGGMYYHDFVVPNVTGIYPVTAFCLYGSSQVYNGVSNAEGNLTEALASEGFTSLGKDELGIMEFEKSDFCNNVVCGYEYNITLPIGFHNEYLSDFRLFLRSHTDANEIFEFYVYNYNTSTDEFIYSYSNNNPVEPTTIQTPLNLSHLSNNSDITIHLLVDDFDTAGKNFELIDLYTSRIYNATAVADLRGGEELVVSKAINNVTINVQSLSGARISVISEEQLGQFLLIAGFLILLFVGLVSASAVIGIAYSFIYLDGLLAIGGAVICVMLLYFGERKRRKK